MNTKHEHGSEGNYDKHDTEFHTALAWLTALSVSIAAWAVL